MGINKFIDNEYSKEIKSPRDIHFATLQRDGMIKYSDMLEKRLKDLNYIVKDYGCEI